jgi:hypothetical protein
MNVLMSGVVVHMIQFAMCRQKVIQIVRQFEGILALAPAYCSPWTQMLADNSTLSNQRTD